MGTHTVALTTSENAQVYGKGDEVICCIEHHKFQPNNFWNGRWRSQWTLNTKTGEGQGVLRLQVRDLTVVLWRLFTHAH